MLTHGGAGRELYLRLPSKIEKNVLIFCRDTPQQLYSRGTLDLRRPLGPSPLAEGGVS